MNAVEKRRAKRNARKKRRSFLSKIAVIGIASYAVIVLVGQQLEITKKQNELADIEQKIQTQQDINKDLDRVLSMGDDKTYIESIAREKLGYAYPDERFYVDVAGN